MKKKEITDLRSKSIDELKVLLLEAKKELSKLRLELVTKKLKNVRQVFSQRKKIAVISTIIHEMEIKNG